MKTNKKYYARVRFNEGDEAVLAIRANSKKRAREILKAEIISWKLS